jgi:hypothetical protein
MPHPTLCFPLQSFMQANINFELEKLRIELRHARGIYAVARSETFDASRKVSMSKCIGFFL